MAPLRIRCSAWCLMDGGLLVYRYTHRQFGPKGEPPTYLYFIDSMSKRGGRPPRWARKFAKLKSKGTFRSRRNRAIERSRIQQALNRRNPGVRIHLYA